jgi:hypothetical protein
MVQVSAQTVGLSSIHSADVCSGAVAGSSMVMEKDQPPVVSEMISIQEPEVYLTEALTLSPGLSGYEPEFMSTA